MLNQIGGWGMGLIVPLIARQLPILLPIVPDLPRA